MDGNIVLSVEHLHKTFGSRKVIDDISFEIRRGEIFGFLGPNGSGKTTTIKMILGLLDYDDGEVTICGYDRKREFESALSHISGIIENPDMYSYLTGYKNLEVFSRLRVKLDRADINRAIEIVGLDYRINEKVRTYSLGMKQRLGIAQAILHSPDILVLDEPTNGMDPAGIKELRDILKTLSHTYGMSVLVSSHIRSEMQLLCDTVCIINAGRTLSINSVEELTEEKEESRFRVKAMPSHKALAILQEKFPDRLNTVDGSDVFIISAGEDEISGVLSALIAGGAMVNEVTPIRRSLEDSYIEITGGGNKIV